VLSPSPRIDVLSSVSRHHTIDGFVAFRCIFPFLILPPTAFPLIGPTFFTHHEVLSLPHSYFSSPPNLYTHLLLTFFLPHRVLSHVTPNPIFRPLSPLSTFFHWNPFEPVEIVFPGRRGLFNRMFFSLHYIQVLSFYHALPHMHKEFGW